jgi:SNF2 family DNA or RNA helicase
VHRLGQTRPVVVQRLVIADTVEDRVLAMQERKQTLADGSLGEGSGKKIGSEFPLLVHKIFEVLKVHFANFRTLCQRTWYVFPD